MRSCKIGLSVLEKAQCREESKRGEQCCWAKTDDKTYGQTVATHTEMVGKGATYRDVEK